MEGKQTPYLFNGKELDEETGLYYYGARYYDPKVSLFISHDPLAEQTGTPYQYCYQNPINLIDPTGMEGEDPPSLVPDSGEVVIIGHRSKPAKHKNWIQRAATAVGNGFSDAWQWGKKQFNKANKKYINRSTSTTAEPDAITIGNTGIDVGIGVKHFKLGNVASIDLDLTAFSIKYNKNTSQFEYEVLSGSAGISVANNLVGGSITLSGIKGNEKDDTSFLAADLSGSFFGITNKKVDLDANGSISVGEGSIYSVKDGWFNWSGGNKSGRTVDVNGDGVPENMFILGGEINYGILSTDIEVNVDEIYSSATQQGTGLGDDWKQ